MSVSSSSSRTSWPFSARNPFASRWLNSTSNDPNCTSKPIPINPKLSICRQWRSLRTTYVKSDPSGRRPRRTCSRKFSVSTIRRVRALLPDPTGSSSTPPSWKHRSRCLRNAKRRRSFCSELDCTSSSNDCSPLRISCWRSQARAPGTTSTLIKLTIRLRRRKKIAQ